MPWSPSIVIARADKASTSLILAFGEGSAQEHALTTGMHLEIARKETRNDNPMMYESISE
jgi:hypothetical protein